MNKRFQVISSLLGFKTLEDFSEALGFSRKYLSILIPRGLNPRFTKRLTENFPRVNLVYLETGEGEPLLPDGVFDVSDIQRAGKVQMVVDVLQQLDAQNLSVILEAVEKFKDTPHYRRDFPEESPEPRKNGKPEKKPKKK